MEKEITIQALKIEDFNDKNFQNKRQSSRQSPFDAQSEKARPSCFSYAIEALEANIKEKTRIRHHRSELCSHRNLAVGIIMKNVQAVRSGF